MQTLHLDSSGLQGKLKVYRHNDMRHLDELLAECPRCHRKLVITDSLFSMDGEMSLRLYLTSLLSGGSVLQIWSQSHCEANTPALHAARNINAGSQLCR